MGHGVRRDHGRARPYVRTASPGGFIGRWIGRLKPVAEQIQASACLTQSERQTALKRGSIRNSIANLRSFPYVREREAAGDLAIHGAWFDIHSGELWVMDPASGHFNRP